MTETGVLTARGLRPLAGPVVRWAARRGTTPAALARAGVVLTVVAAVWFTDPSPVGGLAGALALALVLCCDAVGDRLGEQSSDTLTAWTVAVLVHLREFVLYAALAVGAGLAGRTDAWMWAAGALVAYAVRESVTAARASRSPVPPRRGGPRTSPIEAVDPSRDSREPADPEFTAELLGAARRRDDGAERNDPARGRTALPRREGGARPLAHDGAVPPEAVGKPTAPAPSGGVGELLGALAAFGPSERFLVIAVSVTIWGASAAFPALILGSAVAVAAAAMTPHRDPQ